jgi:hypothetical protein
MSIAVEVGGVGALGEEGWVLEGSGETDWENGLVVNGCGGEAESSGVGVRNGS